MIPLSDENPSRSAPIVTVSLVVLNMAVFLYQLSLGSQVEGFIQACAFRPAELLTGQDLPPPNCVQPPWLTVLTSQFMHAGLLHIGSNLLFLWIFGNNVEDSMGGGRFVIFYLLCGTAAALVQSFMAPGSEIPMIGASGAIGGVLGAYLVLHPRANVRMLFIILFFVRVISVPAAVVLGLWFVMQFISGATTPTTGDDGGVAFWAHVGGFVAGAVLVLLFRDPRLLERHPYYGLRRGSPTRSWHRTR
jgi:membrane associated rhomboid family serine protease